jgi:hypothetical protein
MRIKFLKLSGISLGLSFFVLVFNYFFYHYFGESGFTTEFSKLPRKPFVSDLIGQLGVLLLFCSIVSLIIAFVFYKKED